MKKWLIIIGIILIGTLCLSSSLLYASTHGAQTEDEEYTGENTPDTIHVSDVTDHTVLYQAPERHSTRTGEEGDHSAGSHRAKNMHGVESHSTETGHSSKPERIGHKEDTHGKKSYVKAEEQHRTDRKELTRQARKKVYATHDHTESQGTDSSTIPWMALIGGMLAVGSILIFLFKGGNSMSVVSSINNMKIGTKIIGMVSVILSLMVISAVFGIVKISNIGDEIRGIAEEDIPLTGVATGIASHQMEQAIWVERALRFGEVLAAKEDAKRGLKTAEEEFRRLAGLTDEEFKKAEELAGHAAKYAKTANERKEFEDILDHLKVINREHADFENHVEEVFELIHEGRLNEAEVLAEEIEKEEDDLDYELGQFLGKVEKFTEEAALKAEHDEQVAVRGMWIVGILSLTFGLFAGFFISRSITRPLIEAVKVSNQLAEGDLTMQIEEKGEDETGQLLAAMKNMVENLRDSVQVAGQIAEGDLSVKVKVRSDKDALGKALTSMVKRLREIVGNVKSAADNVASASQEMSSSSEQMSQGANEQASSVEEVSSSIEQMSANINQNADNAQQTEKIALKAAQDAREGGKAVVETVSAMKEIAGKISIIEEIARQTNLLALNAAIEAARAGEHGKGFAVVAAEVRKLAERSQAAAAEIGNLSASSVDIAEQTGEMLAQMVPDIQKTADLVQEIAAASNEQNSGAEQINNAIQQLSQVTQENASASEEIASTAEELTSQAEQLQSTIAFFKIDDTVSPGTRKVLTDVETVPKRGHTSLGRHVLSVPGQDKDSRAVAGGAETEDKPTGIRLDIRGNSGDKTDNEFEKF